MKKLLFFFTLLILTSLQFNAQCLMYPVLLSERIPQSNLIVEGKVINQKSFWNTAHNHIYTSSLIEVYKTFKNTSNPYIEVISEGGIVGNEMHKVEPSLELEIGDLGVFTLIANSEAAQFGKPVYETYAVAQGFIKYDVVNDLATEPFNKYTNASVSLYSTIEQLTGINRSIVKPVNAFQQPTTVINSVQAVAAITSFTPTTITAGTYSVLTINGSGFGATTGTVSFQNADNGGGLTTTVTPNEIISWSATQVKVKVPSQAGTGVIAVNGVSSTQTLTIPYSHLNVDNGAGYNYVTKHINNSGGGYVWTYNNNFITNAPAKAAFERSLGSWRCQTYINWTLSGSTSTISAAAGGDGVNIVTFNSSLGAGVLGNCYSYWGGCGADPNQSWYVTELDIQFSNTPGGLTWQFGPTAPTGSQYDFESVTVHELGHGHQLGHVIKSTDLMHYSLTNGQSKRTLNTDDLNGGLAVMVRNAGTAVCAKPNMIPLNSSNCALGAPTASFTANKTFVCPVGQTVAFTNLSTGSPTANAWVFAGGTPSTSSVTNPTITYNTPGTYSVSLTATNANGSNTYSVLAYIQVGGVSLPLTQNFQSAAFPPTNWSLFDAGTDAINWQLSTSAGQASTQSTVFDNFSDSVTGKLDQIKTAVNLTGFSAASMTFYRAYGATFGGTYRDTLEVRVSTDCGTSSIQKYLRGGADLGTGVGTGASPFVPTAAEWNQDTVDLTPFIGQQNVIVMFINHGHYGDAIYLDNINITGTSASAAPTASFTSNKTVVCPGQTVAFTNLSVGSPTANTWVFAGGTPSTSSVTNPTITYNTPGTYSVSLTATNANGSNTYSVIGYITVNSTATLPLTQDFQTGVFPPTNWSLIDGGADAVKWQLSTGAGQASTQSALFDNFTTNVSGTRDEIKTFVSLTGFTSSKMTFYRAYGLTFTAPNIDSLEVRVSTDCGASSTQVYLRGGSQIATGNGDGVSLFVPTAAQWDPDTVDLTPYVGNPSVMVSIINRAHYGDGMYLDNINITGVTAAAPTATINSVSTACTGQSIALTNTTTGSPTSYSWTMTGGTPVSAATQTTSVTYTTAGVKTVTLTVANATGTTTATKSITITATPILTLTPATTTICAGQTTTLTVTGATTYTWLPVGSGTSSAVTPTATTVYTVTGTTSGCVSAPKTATVNITTAPTITVTPTTTTICSGLSTTLNASGATTYTWLPSGSGASNVVSPAVGTTVYTVTGSIGSCNSTPKNATVTVVSSPTLSASTNNSLICTGYTSSLTVTGNAASYTWSPAGSLSSPNGTVVVASPTITTTYTVTGTLGSCTSTASVVQNISLCTGIASVVASDEVNVFPNPSNGVFSLTYGTTIEEVNVTVINALGQTVKTETAKNISQLSIDLTKMSKGVYYLKASTKDGTKLFKLILE